MTTMLIYLLMAFGQLVYPVDSENVIPPGYDPPIHAEDEIIIEDQLGGI